MLALAVRDDRAARVRHAAAAACAGRRLTVGLPETGNVAESRVIDLFGGPGAVRALRQAARLLRRRHAAGRRLAHARRGRGLMVAPVSGLLGRRAAAQAQRVPLVVGMRPGDLQLAAFVDNWLDDPERRGPRRAGARRTGCSATAREAKRGPLVDPPQRAGLVTLLTKGPAMTSSRSDECRRKLTGACVLSGVCAWQRLAHGAAPAAGGGPADGTEPGDRAHAGSTR